MDAASIVEALTTPEGRADPYPLYARARELGSVAAVTEGWFLVSGYAAVNAVLRDSRMGVAVVADGSANHEALAALSQSILRADPPDHPRMRSLIASVFTPRRVTALQPAIEAAVDLLLNGLTEAAGDGGRVDFMEQFAFQLPVSVICELLGVPPADRHRFRALAADVTVALELMTDASDLEPADAAAQELTAYFQELIAQRRHSPQDDLIGALVAARDAEDGQLSDVELLANLVVLLVAGFETTTDLLGNGLAILFQRPELAARLRSGALPVTGFVEEVLRYDPPVQATTRVARARDVTLEGTPIPQDGRLVLLIGSANRDPARYSNPDEFEPTRTGSTPLSFGAGAHICLGNNLARLEAVTAFPRLLARFPDLAPAGAATRRDRLILRGYETLPITITTDTTTAARRESCEDAGLMSTTNVSHGGPVAHRAGARAHPNVVPPWEIGRPQPVFLALAGAGAFRGRLLDVGCGTGEHALLAAGLGIDVTGVDLNVAALRIAERKAAARGLTARFVRLDARRLADFDTEPFDTVIDSELFHALEGADRAAYVTGLRAALRPGGRLFMLCYSNAQPDVPHRVSLDDILAAFTDGWRIDSIEPVTIDTNVHPEGVRGWLARLTRTMTTNSPVTPDDLRHNRERSTRVRSPTGGTTAVALPTAEA
jgi:cytochrome P450/SAM-dependent methyltransferase